MRLVAARLKPGPFKEPFMKHVLAIDKILEKDELGNLEGGFPLVFDAQPLKGRLISTNFRHR
jgi:hypothetical protein